MPQLDPFIFFDEAYGTGLTLVFFWVGAFVYAIPGLVRNRSWICFGISWDLVRIARRGLHYVF